MITAQDLYNTNFYDRIASGSFYGSLDGLCYRIKKETAADTDPVFCVTTWPGPYCYDKTPDDQKTRVSFPYENASLAKIAAYLNQCAAK